MIRTGSSLVRLGGIACLAVTALAGCEQPVEIADEGERLFAGVCSCTAGVGVPGCPLLAAATTTIPASQAAITA